MSTDNLTGQVVNATKWSAITEILAKLITPITSMVMARLLTPESFGIVATFSIIISFADIFADAGFQRYLIQHDFDDESELEKSTNVAFWTNLTLSFLLWAIIIIFRNPLASLVGSSGLGIPLVVASAGIPLTGFCSIQIALFKRSFDFKTLFKLRLVSILVPIFVTIPLALLMRNYWALVLGTLVANLSNAILLTIKSSWKPRFYFDNDLLKAMLSFCIWSLIDAILVWVTSYADIFFIGKVLNSYYLGLYRTSMSMVGSIVSIVTAIVLPVIFPTLSRLQDDHFEMCRVLLRFQKTTAIILIPLGVGIFVFRGLITEILLGPQWCEAADFLGLWGLMEAVTIVFARFCSPVYPAIGKPHISVIVQISHLVCLLPTIFIAGRYGFAPLYISRSLIRFELVAVNIIAVYIVIRQSPIKMVANIYPEFVCSLIMAIVGHTLIKINDGMFLSFVWVFCCFVLYVFSLVVLFPKERKILLDLKNNLIRSFVKK